MGAPGERWLLPEEILIRINERLDDEVGDSSAAELYRQLLYWVKSEEFKKFSLTGFQLPSQRSIERAVSVEDQKAGVFVPNKTHGKRVTRTNLLNVLCFYAFGKSWKDTLIEIGKTENDIRKVYIEDGDEPVEFIAKNSAEKRNDKIGGQNETTSPELLKPKKRIGLNKLFIVLILFLSVGFGIYIFISLGFNTKTSKKNNKLLDTSAKHGRLLSSTVYEIDCGSCPVDEHGSTLYKINGFLKNPNNPLSIVGTKYNDSSTIYALLNGVVFFGNNLSKDTNDHENAAVLTKVDYVDNLSKKFDLSRFPVYSYLHFKGDSIEAYNDQTWDSLYKDYQAKVIKGVIISGFGDSSDAHFQRAVNRYVSLQRYLISRGIRINQNYFRYGIGNNTDLFIIRAYW